jgi:hypothetical protein
MKNLSPLGQKLWSTASEGYKKPEWPPYHLNFTGKSHFLPKANKIPDMWAGLIADQVNRDPHSYTQLAEHDSYFT